MNIEVILDEGLEDYLYWRRYDLQGGLQSWLNGEVNPFGFEHVVLAVYTSEKVEQFSEAMINSVASAVAAYKTGVRYVDEPDVYSIPGRVTTLLDWWEELQAAKPTNYQDGFGG